ncbi:hypothetical protein ABB37_05175 [Leptomonas pyrrhocoris]|uniref:Uncharacterized protein n=1 Tax=Leptomonas pyrrhocoris TaxID=157538 RepID=A0A0N0VF72_LEPPY|nr:hypothetical protein ABB37_05175 [Leptomonas pyrrhocoris]XP_015658634.1 hypothetical protein ABB37_05175 [Leptomonas pyrrhocoris]KPA80194.1 hypothetical protein ABB37_05175 [Leptomonas pyrrhocoris]KPA80195.1 hypothetical protein ABB37_05175 [Leptomonas pyrrhocoris]|eukprot:XP_015658633.1 hypothetical protein ABB37_05175 [Leptomonas pyrrhocoris]
MILLSFICGTLGLIWWVYTIFAYRPRRLAGATVVVTGACSEVGRRLCIQLYACGARVVAWDYSRIKLQELQVEVQRVVVAVPDSASSSSSSSYFGNHFVITAVDASSRMQVQRAAKEIDGPVDVIINAAHAYPSKPLHDRNDDSIDRVVQTNFVSPLLVVRQLLPSLMSTADSGAVSQSARHRDDYAQVVNIVCAAGNYVVAAHAPDYAASQWGMVGLHYSMRAWIAQERAMYTQSSAGRKDAAAGEKCKGTSSGGGSSSNTAATTGTGEGSGPVVGRGVQRAREVRTTLLCLNDVQNGIPTALNSLLAPASSMRNAPSSSSTTPDRDDVAASSSGSGSGARAARASSSPREGYTLNLQKRNAELDRAVACCMAAICRGQERYCYASSWTTTLISPMAMLCPLPWAERLLRWLQRSCVPVAASEP